MGHLSGERERTSPWSSSSESLRSLEVSEREEEGGSVGGLEVGVAGLVLLRMVTKARTIC